MAISPQQAKYTKQIVKKLNLTFPVLVDTDNSYAKKLNLAFTLPEKIKEIYTTFGIDLPRFNGNDSWQLPMSGRFIVDTQGIIRKIDVHADHTIRPEPSELIELLQNL